MQASTISQNDCMLRRGVCLQVMDPVCLPATPGGDVVGYILKIGEKVRHFTVGDRVATLVRTGGNARYISVPAVNLVQVPRSCDSAEAACMVSTYMTAYQALRMVTKDQFTLSGKRILVTGGIEPCGQALIQLCFRAGAEEVFATAPDHRHRYVKSVLGAQPLPVHPKDWSPTIKGKMDIVFDGACHDVDSTYASLKSDGVLVVVGMSALLCQEQLGVFGAPITAYWTKLKGHLMTNTKSYEVWDSFNANKEAFKVCTFLYLCDDYVW
jgi:NADPH:quinone reductase-like Zn-dependent oxidoreductase